MAIDMGGETSRRACEGCARLGRAITADRIQCDEMLSDAFTLELGDTLMNFARDREHATRK
jgi:hypothetical protein